MKLIDNIFLVIFLKHVAEVLDFEWIWTRIGQGSPRSASRSLAFSSLSTNWRFPNLPHPPHALFRNQLWSWKEKEKPKPKQENKKQHNISKRKLGVFLCLFAKLFTVASWIIKGSSSPPVMRVNHDGQGENYVCAARRPSQCSCTQQRLQPSCYCRQKW